MSPGTTFRRLAEPFELAGLRLPNRIVMPAMGTGLPEHDGTCNDATIAYYRRRAEGGVGMITLEASLVSPDAYGVGPELRLHGEEFVPGGPRLEAERVAGQVRRVGVAPAVGGRDVEQVPVAGVGGVTAEGFALGGVHAVLSRHIAVRADHSSGKTTRAMLRCNHASPAEPPLPTLAPMVRWTAVPGP